MTADQITRRVALGTLAATALTACVPQRDIKSLPTGRNPDFERIRYTGAKIPLRVESVRTVVRPRLTSDLRPIDADFPISPEQVAREWKGQRLAPMGGPATADYVIDDASAISRQVEGGETVIATIQARLIINTAYGVEAAGAGARVEAETLIKGAPTIIERQEFLHAMAESMAAELDRKLTESVQRNLGGYIGA